jgi:putative transposase
LWSERRTVRRTATVSLHGNTYQVDPSLALRKVELVFDPFDLTSIEVRWQGRTAGHAIPHVIGRHAHPKARPEQPAPSAPVTGIDYMGLIDAAHDTALAGGAISFAGLSDPTGLAGPGQLPGQVTIDEALAIQEAQ